MVRKICLLIFSVFFMSCASYELTGDKEGDILIVYMSKGYNISYILLNINYNIIYGANKNKYSGVSGYYGWIKLKETITDNYILELDFDSYGEMLDRYELKKKEFPVQIIEEGQIMELIEKNGYELVFLMPNKHTGDKIEYSNGIKHVSGNSIELRKNKKYVILVEYLMHNISHLDK